MSDEYETVEVDGDVAYCCPGCGQKPQWAAVRAGVNAHCETDECPVEIWAWFNND